MSVKYEQPRGATHTRQVKNTAVAALAGLLGGLVARLAHRVGWQLSTRRAATLYVVGIVAASWWLPFPLLLLALVAGAAGAWTVEVRQPRWWRRELERQDRRYVALHWQRAKDLIPRVRWVDGEGPWAIDSNGEPVAPPRADHMLIGGMTGAGKSGAMNGALYWHAADPTVHIAAIDLKRGIELRDWLPRLDVRARTHEEAQALLTALRAMCEERLDAVEAAQPAKNARELGLPTILVPVDELQELVDGHDRIKDDLESLARLGRAAGIFLISATQHPTAKAIGTTFRGQHGLNVLLRVRSRPDADVIFGQGVLGEGDRLREDGVYVPWEGNIEELEDRPDSGRALLRKDGRVREVRFLWRSVEDIQRKAQVTAGIAGDPLVTLGPPVPLAAPVDRMTRDELIAEVNRRRIPAPSDLGDRFKWPKARIRSELLEPVA